MRTAKKRSHRARDASHPAGGWDALQPAIARLTGRSPRSTASTSPEVHRMLVVARGWSSERYAEHLATTWRATLLA